MQDFTFLQLWGGLWYLTSVERGDRTGVEGAEWRPKVGNKERESCCHLHCDHSTLFSEIYIYSNSGQCLSGLRWRWSLWLVNRMVLLHSNAFCSLAITNRLGWDTPTTGTCCDTSLTRYNLLYYCKLIFLFQTTLSACQIWKPPLDIWCPLYHVSD